jgi:hypothetical protein
MSETRRNLDVPVQCVDKSLLHTMLDCKRYAESRKVASLEKALPVTSMTLMSDTPRSRTAQRGTFVNTSILHATFSFLNLNFYIAR